MNQMEPKILGTAISDFILIFFGLGFVGWAAETIQETIVRKKFVSKGFFKGPFVLCHALGGVAVYATGLPLKTRPVLVFFAGLAVCTAIEYLAAVFLEKCFKVKCWDYATYPHTKWCHFKGRIALTLSLAFGFLTIFVVYFFWDFMLNIAGIIGKHIRAVNIVLCSLFFIDAVYSCIKILKAKKAGIKVKGYAVFTDSGDIE